MAKGEITIHFTPELQEFVNVVKPVAEASAALFDCICEHGGAINAPECTQQAVDWAAMTTNYTSHLRFRDNDAEPVTVLQRSSTGVITEVELK